MRWLIFLILALPFPTLADTIPGPILADVVRIVDRDTIWRRLDFARAMWSVLLSFRLSCDFRSP
jgi:hypothetical protein